MCSNGVLVNIFRYIHIQVYKDIFHMLSHFDSNFKVDVILWLTFYIYVFYDPKETVIQSTEEGIFKLKVNICILNEFGD